LKEAIIAKEGMKLIIPSFVLSAVLFIIRFSILTDVLAAIVLFFCLFCVYFFRNPKRHADAPPDALIAPADGTITEITDLMEAEFLDNETTRITIFMSPVDVHVNRAPCDGRIARVVHKSGEFAVAFKKDIDKENERNYILIEHGAEKILLVQIAGFLARRIISYVRENDVVSRGDRVGIIAFGSRVDIYFPKTYESMVQLGQKVKAGLTVLADKKGSL